MLKKKQQPKNKHSQEMYCSEAKDGTLMSYKMDLALWADAN